MTVGSQDVGPTVRGRGTRPRVRSMLTDSALREAFSHFPQGVVLVAAEIDGVRHGLVASTFTVGVSLEPPLVSVAVQHSSRTWPLLREHGHLGVTVLGDRQRGVTRQLAGPDRERRFEGLDVEAVEHGALVLQGAPAWVTVRSPEADPGARETRLRAPDSCEEYASVTPICRTAVQQLP